jgi:hypothetical protein
MHLRLNSSGNAESLLLQTEIQERTNHESVPGEGSCRVIFRYGDDQQLKFGHVEKVIRGSVKVVCPLGQQKISSLIPTILRQRCEKKRHDCN